MLGKLVSRLSGGRRKQSAAASEKQHQTNENLTIENLRLITRVLETPAFVIDGAGRVLCHNPRSRELFLNIADGQPLFQVSRNPGLLEAVQRAREQDVAQTGEIADRGTAGRRLIVTVSPLTSAGASTGGIGVRGGARMAGIMLVQFRDLSEQDRLAQLRSDFIANASHELRTPLASLKGFIETLQGPASGDAAARTRFLGIMEAQAARMARILDDLLALSRIEMRAHVPPQDDVDLSLVVRAAAQGLEPIASAAKIRINLDAPVQPCLVRGDRDELEQVFQNLIENAVKYGHEGGKVDVTIVHSVDGRARTIAVVIADDGPGIAEEHRPRLTERFYRIDTAASRERGGTGLGLAIVKHILNRHQGELEIASELGKGSTFTVILKALP
jgi:two-component system, OmpR family, phosphate regulon sensor histidine kinase PhoR